MNILENKIDDFKLFYDSKNEYYKSALNFLIKQISLITEVELVTGRIKDYDECVSKFERKYLPNISAENTSYNISDYISDLIGIRAVCFYLEDVNKIRKKLRKHFHETDITNKTLQLEKTENKFGYRSLHLDLSLKRENLKNSEKNKYHKVHFELQIRTIVQDAWSVLDHKIKYKKSIPHTLKRRINRLSALFEIADDEFSHIKEEIVLEEKKINERIKKNDIIEKNKPLDVFRFLFIALKYFPEYNFIEYKVDGFVQEILDIKKDFTESELNNVLLKNLHIAEQVAVTENKVLNPYTKIRYCLFLYHNDIFSNILSSYQKDTIGKINI